MTASPEQLLSFGLLAERRPLWLACNRFAPRHNSATAAEVQEMVEVVGYNSVDELIDATVPAAIRRDPMDLGAYTKGFTESGILKKLRCASTPVHATM